MPLKEQWFVLQYPQEDQFVALDAASGGYPYPVVISKAHNFGSEEKAKAYMAREDFRVRRVLVTYELE